MTTEIIVTSIVQFFLSAYFTSNGNKDKVSFIQADEKPACASSNFQLITPKL